MKNFLILSFLVICFIVGFLVTYNAVNSLLLRKNTYSAENLPAQYIWIIVFTEDKVKAIHLDELEEFKSNNSKYSFLVPDGKEYFYNEQLAKENRKPLIQFEVNRISKDKQLIKITSGGGKGYIAYWHEVLDKKIVPIEYLDFGLIEAFWNLIGGVLGGIFITIIGFIILQTFSINLKRTKLN